MGASALQANTTGSHNTADGRARGALAKRHGRRQHGCRRERTQSQQDRARKHCRRCQRAAQTTAEPSNTATGAGALVQNVAGANNTATGYRALGRNGRGFANTAVGFFALFNNDTGDNNTAIGATAGVETSGLSNTTAIGSGARADGSNQVVLGNEQVVLVKTHGDLRVGAGTSAGCVTSGDGSVLIAGNCQSDARLKKDVRPFAPVLERLAQLHPVYFRWKAEELRELQLGSGEASGSSPRTSKP